MATSDGQLNNKVSTFNIPKFYFIQATHEVTMLTQNFEYVAKCVAKYVQKIKFVAANFFCKQVQRSYATMWCKRRVHSDEATTAISIPSILVWIES